MLPLAKTVLIISFTISARSSAEMTASPSASECVSRELAASEWVSDTVVAAEEVLDFREDTCVKARSLFHACEGGGGGVGVGWTGREGRRAEERR